MRKTIEEAANRKFFWLDYFGEAIEEHSRSIRREERRNKQVLLAQAISTVLSLVSLKTDLLPLFASLMMSLTVAYMVLHILWVKKLGYAEKMMRCFHEAEQELSSQIQGGK
jgi:hypothetical protein